MHATYKQSRLSTTSPSKVNVFGWASLNTQDLLFLLTRSPLSFRLMF